MGTRQTDYHEALLSSANDEVRCDCTFADDGNASWYLVCRVPMVEWRLDCENWRHLTVIGLHDIESTQACPLFDIVCPYLPCLSCFHQPSTVPCRIVFAWRIFMRHGHTILVAFSSRLSADICEAQKPAEFFSATLGYVLCVLCMRFLEAVCSVSSLLLLSFSFELTGVLEDGNNNWWSQQSDVRAVCLFVL